MGKCAKCEEGGDGGKWGSAPNARKEEMVGNGEVRQMRGRRRWWEMGKCAKCEEGGKGGMLSANNALCITA